VAPRSGVKSLPPHQRANEPKGCTPRRQGPSALR
jgi:hypothetical protein